MNMLITGNEVVRLKFYAFKFTFGQEVASGYGLSSGEHVYILE